MASPDMFPLSDLPEPRICGGAIGGCGRPVGLGNDAAAHEYLLTWDESAIQQPTHHLVPVFDGEHLVCEGLPMLARHFGMMSQHELEIYRREDPSLDISTAYRMAYINLGRIAAYQAHLEATTPETVIEVPPPRVATESRIAALFRLAASHIV